MASSYTISFAEPNRVTYSLIELPSELLALLESNSTALEIKGQANDEAVLCSPTSTYAVRAVQTSNSLLLCSSNAKDVQVLSTLKQSLDATLCKPNLSRLDDLLAEHTWIHDEIEPDKVVHCLSLLLSYGHSSD